MTMKFYLCCLSECYAFVFRIYDGNCHDAPQIRKLIETIYFKDDHNLFMDKAYENDKTLALAEV